MSIALIRSLHIVTCTDLTLCPISVYSYYVSIKKIFKGQAWCFTPVIPATLEAAIGRIVIQGQPGQWWLVSVILAIQEAVGKKTSV
jgi:hypothetical protein